MKIREDNKTRSSESTDDDFIVKLALKSKMSKDLRDEPHEEMHPLSYTWTARCATISRSM